MKISVQFRVKCRDETFDNTKHVSNFCDSNIISTISILFFFFFGTNTITNFQMNKLLWQNEIIKRQLGQRGTILNLFESIEHIGATRMLLIEKHNWKTTTNSVEKENQNSMYYL